MIHQNPYALEALNQYVMRAQYTPAMSAEQAISKLAFSVREIERLPRDGWSEQQIERLRALVSAADGAVVKMEGDANWGR